MLLKKKKLMKAFGELKVIDIINIEIAKREIRGKLRINCFATSNFLISIGLSQNIPTIKIITRHVCN